uniref:Uncharacterized protein n=2 Tax=Avena sativa TaxID=4498 RepID=A0ACD5WQ55_AVESA
MVVPDGGGGDQKKKPDGEIQEEAAGNINVKDHIALYFGSPRTNGHSFQHLEKPYRFTASHEPSSNPQPSTSPPSTEQMLGVGEQRNGSSSGSQRSSRRFAIPLVRKIDWGSLWDRSKEWIRNPVNMALFVWVVAVGVSGAILFMVMTGMLNGVLRSKAQKDTWFEVNNQILNALFTLMCLIQHPRRCYHLALLCRWRGADMLALRDTYCKDGTVKPNERKHMMVVVLLLHLNCFAQYALCGLNLGLHRNRRPPVGVALTISVAICAPAVAGLYNNLSPLGKDYEAQAADDEESGSAPQLQRKTIEKRYSFATAQRVAFVEEEGDPEWKGGVFDLWDDISLAYLSMFCSCCVFGWNTSRLGFGNMYVHTVTFILFCLAPFFIFTLAAVNIDNESVRDALGLGGALLCFLGLLYGGFWRIQMRRRFRLPANHFCCGKPDVTDCFQWLCCCPCSLAQEVRTADAYQIVQEDRMDRHRRGGDDDSSSQVQMPSHGGDVQQQPLRFAGVFVPDGVSNASTNTIPPAVPPVVIHK